MASGAESLAESEEASNGDGRTGDLGRSAILNQLRSELLDERAASLNRWLTACALVLAFFGIVAAIAGYFGIERFSELDAEIEGHLRRVQDAVRRIEEHDRTATGLVGKLEKRFFSRTCGRGCVAASP